MMAAIEPLPDIPLETSQAANHLYGHQYIYLRIGDHLKMLYDQLDVRCFDPFARLDDATTIRLALATAFQRAEALPDIKAAEATYSRIDWKYALSLPMHHPGITETVLCEFRQGLFSSPKALNEFGFLLDALNNIGLNVHSPYRTNQPVGTLTSICQFNRLYQLRGAMKSALGMLVAEAPEWLLENVSPYWYERYKTGGMPQVVYSSDEHMQEEAIRLGKDIQFLIEAINKQNLSGLSDWPEIQKLSQLLKENFGGSSTDLHWLLPECANCADRLQV